MSYFWSKLNSMLALADYTAIIEEKLGKLNFPDYPEGLYKPVQYILGLGGKRIRPALVLMSANLFGDNTNSALPAALAIEIFHNFTLMHDDIMDKSDMRRGKATVHKLWNNNTAILSGDAAMILAYNELNKLPAELFNRVFPVFNRTALEVCEGQQLDVDFEKRLDVSLEEYLEMIRLKTSVLLAASMKIGAICGGALVEEQDALYEVGENIGLAFQLQDDYLDVYADEKKFGKQTGTDIVNNKKTYLLIKALNSGNKDLVNQLNKWIEKSDFDKNEKILEIKKIYNQLSIKDDTQLAAINYINKAIEIFNSIQVAPERKKPIEVMVFNLIYREV